MGSWYFRDGSLAVTEPIGSPKWTEQMSEVNKLLGDIKYKRVVATNVGKYWISTVWLGTDMSFDLQPNHKPLIFETMVFKKGDSAGLDMERYSTEKEALAGHKALVKKWKKKVK